MQKDSVIPKISLLEFLKNGKEIKQNPLPFNRKQFEKYGDLFELKIGFKNSLFFTRNAALTEYVLVTNQKNYTKTASSTKDFAKYVGKGLLTAEGKHWRKQRKMIQPGFHKKQLHELFDVMKKTIGSELENIEPNKPINIYPILGNLAFKTVINSLFHSEVNDSEIQKLQKLTDSTQETIIKELRQPYLAWWYNISGSIKKQLNLVDQAREILLGLVDERKKSKKRHNDLLDMLLDARYEDGGAMDEAQLIDEILILFIAGYETTACALTYSLQLLSKHKNWQNKIVEEIRELKTKSSDTVEWLKGSKTTLQVLEESMRLYPPAYFLDRLNYEDDSFQDIKLKAGSNLVILTYEIHRHPKLWEKPDSFSPERFEGGSMQYASQYFPFGAGPRKCVGYNFAIYEMILALQEILIQYEVFPHFDAIESDPMVVLKPKNGFLEFKKRE